MGQLKSTTDHAQNFIRATIVAVCCIASAVSSPAQSGGKPGLPHSARASSPDKPAKPVLTTLAPVLAEVKAKTRIAVLLPSELPQPLAKARYAIVETASEEKYSISVYYELGAGDSGFAASFTGIAHPNYGPKDIANVSKVKLSRGLIGYFRPVSCGGSCAPASLWWEDDQIVYQIQLKFLSTLPENAQQRAITTTANSAITGGPR
jgi:hypothetical protein